MKSIDEVLEAASAKAQALASAYTVAFVLDKKLLGSGTLVEFKSRFGILTASHVWDVVKKKLNSKPNVVGLVIGSTTHNFYFEKDHLNLVFDTGFSENGKGPDLALV